MEREQVALSRVAFVRAFKQQVRKVVFHRLLKVLAPKQQNNSPAVWAGLIPIPSAWQA